MKDIFRNINKFKENKEKFAEALNKLKENLSIYFNENEK